MTAIPSDLDARARVAFEAGRYAHAAELLEQAALASPAEGAIRVNLGLCRQRVGELPAAIAQFRQAVALAPGLAEAWSGLGDVLRESGQIEAALEALRNAVALAPLQSGPQLTLAMLLQQLGRIAEAEQAMRRALSLDPGNANIWCNLGVLLQDRGAIRDALTAYRKALRLDPAHKASASNLQMCLQYDAGASARELRQAALDWGRTLAAGEAARREPRVVGGRLRIGYVSGDFLMHPVGWFGLPVLREHDKAAVEVFCYANQAREDALTQQLKAAADHWRNTLALDDEALCGMIRADRIDVLVDLAGHTSGNRLGVFARKPAPVQLAWLGYFASTGLAAMDAVIFSADQAGSAAEGYLVEPVERLSRSHFAYAPPDYAPPVRERDTRPGAIVFGSFSNAAKLNDEVIRLWSRVLEAVPGSRLLLKWKTFADAGVRAALLARFASHGCAPERVELRGPSEHARMLAEYGDIDIALDPFPFSGALTTCEALWMGVPVVTLLWQRPVARQTYALLRALGLEELAAATPDAYVALCARLAGDAVTLRQWRGSLRARMTQSALLDGAGLARALEDVYLRRTAGLSGRNAWPD